VPSEPVRELVMQDIKSALELIVEGDTYWNTVNTVSRELKPPTSTTGTHLFVYSPGDSVLPYDGRSTSTGVIDTQMQIDIIAWMPREIASDTASQRLVADIETAILADRTRGGNAINTRLLGREVVTADANEPLSQVTVRFVVRYRTTFGDPGTQR